MSERRVIKVPSQPQPMPNEMMPPAPEENMPPMPPSPDGTDLEGNMPNQFDTNFDAGVEADEETDPKKYIQQLTGKLSQSLRSYNENLPQPDADLDKYVAGMIIKQAIEGLSPEDTNEILDKVKNDGGEDEIPQEEEVPQGEMPQQQDPNNGGSMGMGESRNISKESIDEIVNQVMQTNDNSEEITKPITNIGYKKKPFTSPTFK